MLQIMRRGPHFLRAVTLWTTFLMSVGTSPQCVKKTNTDCWCLGKSPRNVHNAGKILVKLSPVTRVDPKNDFKLISITSRT